MKIKKKTFNDQNMTLFQFKICLSKCICLIMFILYIKRFNQYSLKKINLNRINRMPYSVFHLKSTVVVFFRLLN